MASHVYYFSETIDKKTYPINMNYIANIVVIIIIINNNNNNMKSY